jgi:uncharacterized lipoprotein YehR (DUF1307 family)
MGGNMKRILSIVIIVVIILSLVGCGGNDLLGTWKMDMSEETPDLGIDLTIAFTEDKMEIMGMEFEYEVKGDKILVDMFGEGEEEMQFKVNGDKLTLTTDGEEQILNRVKE